MENINLLNVIRIQIPIQSTFTYPTIQAYVLRTRINFFDDSYLSFVVCGVSIGYKHLILNNLFAVFFQK